MHESIFFFFFILLSFILYSIISVYDDDND